jgi:NAD-dependent deacetylase
MKSPLQPNKITIFSGAGISVGSGLPTFRDEGGLWEGPHKHLSTAGAWDTIPAQVLDFYNSRREAMQRAQPNAAHFAIAKLEEKYDVTVITQNVDDLHERAGSSHVIHLHGNITEVRSTADPALIPPPLQRESAFRGLVPARKSVKAAHRLIQRTY